MNATSDLTVANTIAQQIGGKAFYMMGTQRKFGGSNFLIFNIRGSKIANKVQVTLDPSDTYTVEFFKLRGLNCKSVAKFSDIYVDALRGVIESTTGLALSL
jgi:hypothetical protein